MNMDREDITLWMIRDGWSLHVNGSTLLVFLNLKGLPEGMRREARVELGFSAHVLSMWLVAWNGTEKLMHEHTGPELHFEDDETLAGLVHSLGPISWNHVIEQFAVEVGLPTQEDVA